MCLIDKMIFFIIESLCESYGVFIKSFVVITDSDKVPSVESSL